MITRSRWVSITSVSAAPTAAAAIPGTDIQSAARSSISPALR